MSDDEDGSDPRRFFDRRGLHGKPHADGRKGRQICQQVQEALVGILADCADDVVRSLCVVMVEPAPHTGRLLVTVAVDPTADVIDPATIATHLHRATGWLRHEIAHAIHRKRTPEIVFALIPGEPGSGQFLAGSL